MIIDVDFLAVQTNRDGGLEAELLALFVAQLEAADASLAHLPDIEAALNLLHRLKGSARAIGAMTLADWIERIEERIGHARDPAPFVEERDHLRKLMREASVCAASLIAARVSPGLAKRSENG